MNVPISLLRAFVDPLPEPTTLADLLAGLGLAVEAVHERPGIPAGVIVAEIIEAQPIAGSDHLTRTVVDDGTTQRTVVCGAPNARVGLRTALATPGTHLPAIGMTVGTRTVMGVESDGMLCSAKELGVYDDARGIVAYGSDVQPGQALDEAWTADTILELELTPNRADAFSLLGVARDVAAKLGQSLLDPSETVPQGATNGDDGLTVDLTDLDGCPHLVLQRIDGVQVAASPLWLQRNLALLGLRPRNNVVDVTNYVTFALGQPSHAYDARVLTEGRLQVRRATRNETVALLDGDTYELNERDLVIATDDASGGSQAIGLAGVMGGLHDSVRDDTTTVALEVASFDPVSVRVTAKRHGLHTDAHVRFERGVDPALQSRAAAYAAHLIAEVAGGAVHPATTRAGTPGRRSDVAFRPSRVPFLMAFDVPTAVQRGYLEALGCTVREDAEDAWTVTPPTWRFDLAIEEDLVEEVGRLHGYEHIGSSRPDMVFTPPRTDPTHRSLRDELAAAGMQETIHYVFTGDAELARARAPQARVRLANPQGIERACLRTALYPGLLNAAVTNRAEPSLALFEVGRVFLEPERERLALLQAGAVERSGWRADVPADLWRLKGTLANLAERRNVAFAFEPALPSEAPMLHPGVAARILWNGRMIGVAGRLHPEVAAAYALGEVYLAELDLPLDAHRLTVRDVARQPYAERDLAIVAPSDVPYAALADLARSAAGDRLDALFPFDVYQGAPLAEHERSVALRLRWRHPDRALRDEEVDEDLARVVEAVAAAGYRIRQ